MTMEPVGYDLNNTTNNVSSETADSEQECCKKCNFDDSNSQICEPIRSCLMCILELFTACS